METLIDLKIPFNIFIWVLTSLGNIQVALNVQSIAINNGLQEDNTLSPVFLNLTYILHIKVLSNVAIYKYTTDLLKAVQSEAFMKARGLGLRFSLASPASLHTTTRKIHHIFRKGYHCLPHDKRSL